MQWSSESWQARNTRLAKWTKWYAWYPVRIDEKLVWLEPVMRRYKYLMYRDGHSYEYKQLEE